MQMRHSQETQKQKEIKRNGEEGNNNVKSSGKLLWDSLTMTLNY